MRILWWGCAPWANTGYGVQARTFLERIAKLGHEVAVCATYGAQGAIVPWAQSIPVFPGAGSPFAQNLIQACADRTQADVVVSLGDVWPLVPTVLEKLTTRWCPWTPIDTAHLPSSTAVRLHLARRPIAMSRHGQRCMETAGIRSSYVPHGFDAASYFPVEQSSARELLRWESDRFVVAMVAQNALGFAVPNRKCFDEQIAAFKMLRVKHSDALLYIHSHPKPGGEASDLYAICARHGLEVGRDVRFPDPVDLQLGLPSDYLRLVYSASDVLLSVSAGEGFGVPCIEAEACGCPIIGGDWSATAELVGPGWRVDKSDAHEFYIDLWKSTWHLPHPRAILEQLEAAYDARGDLALRTRAAEFASAYEADHVTETYWKPLLGSLEAREERGASCDLAAE